MNNPIRALSIHEASFPIYAQLSPGAGNIVACLRLQGNLSVQQANKGMQKLMASEPSMRAGYRWMKVNNHAQNYYAVTPSQNTLPFEEVPLALDEGYEQAIMRVNTSMLNQSFQQDALLWRARLVSDGDQHCLVFCINHALSDGTSINYLVNRWLQALDSQTDLPVASTQLAAPLWHYMPASIAGFFGAFRVLGLLGKFMKAQKLADQGLSFKVGSNVPAMEHRCLSAYGRLDEHTLANLKTLVKKHHKSLHGIIGAALSGVFLSDCEKNDQLGSLKSTFSMPFVTTINVRDKITPPIKDTTAGSFSSGITSMLNVDKSQISKQYLNSPWLLADQITTGIMAGIKEHQHWKVLRIYQLAGLKGLKKMFMDSSEKSLATPISFANMGQVKFSSESLAVVNYEAYAAFHVSGAGMNIAVNTLNDILTLCITCPSPAVTQQTLDGYTTQVIHRLKKWAKLSADE